MGAAQSRVLQLPPGSEAVAFGPPSGSRAHVPSIVSNSQNAAYIYGSGSITNNNQTMTYIVAARPPALSSDISVSAVLPAMPAVFHGREKIVGDAVRLLTASDTARFAILGSGGIGKTSVALAILHNRRITAFYGRSRYFLSCEAIFGADAMVVALAKVLGLPAFDDLLNAVVTFLMNGPRKLLVLDNIETTRFVGSSPSEAFDELLGKLADTPSLSLIITCRRRELPASVKWSNVDNPALEPFSLDAALQTFQDSARCRLAGSDEDIAKQLLDAVDRMPLAVSLLGQLVHRGNSVSELLDRWNQEGTNLLQTHREGRKNSVKVSILISIKDLRKADTTQEALRLLSACCMLPDGLHLGIFEKLRSQFNNINRARDDLLGYDLVSLNADRVLKALSPIRHFVTEHYPAPQALSGALYAIYFDIAESLPIEMSEQFKQLAEISTPEIGNLSSLLRSLVSQPSQRIVDAVINVTFFESFRQPTTSLLSALLQHLEERSQWHVACLRVMGFVQCAHGEFGSAIATLNTAMELSVAVGDPVLAAACKLLAGDALRVIGDFERAHVLLSEARAAYHQLDDEYQRARCTLFLGEWMRQKKSYPAAIDHLEEARQVFSSRHKLHDFALSSQFLGNLYLDQGKYDTAVVEFEAARTALVALGHQRLLVQCTCLLAEAYRRKKDFPRAERLLGDAEALCKTCSTKAGFARIQLERGRLRRDQGYWDEAITHMGSALELYKMIGMQGGVDTCREQIRWLESTTFLPIITTKVTLHSPDSWMFACL